MKYAYPFLIFGMLVKAFSALVLISRKGEPLPTYTEDNYFEDAVLHEQHEYKTSVPDVAENEAEVNHRIAV